MDTYTTIFTNRKVIKKRVKVQGVKYLVEQEKSCLKLTNLKTNKPIYTLTINYDYTTDLKYVKSELDVINKAFSKANINSYVLYEQRWKKVPK